MANDGRKEWERWREVAHDSFHYDMGVMSAKEKSIYKSILYAEAEIKRLREAIINASIELGVYPYVGMGQGTIVKTAKDRLDAALRAK